MKYCPKCDEMIPDEAVRKRVRTPEEAAELDAFAMNVALELGISLEESSCQEPEFLYHVRTGIAGSRRPGVYGGWHSVRISCGPLRDPTPAEISAHEESSRWDAMFKNTSKTK